MKEKYLFKAVAQCGSHTASTFSFFSRIESVLSLGENTFQNFWGLLSRILAGSKKITSFSSTLRSVQDLRHEKYLSQTLLLFTFLALLIHALLFVIYNDCKVLYCTRGYARRSVQ